MIEHEHYAGPTITTNGQLLFRAFADISRGFVDWYNATQVDISLAEEVLYEKKH